MVKINKNMDLNKKSKLVKTQTTDKRLTLAGNASKYKRQTTADNKPVCSWTVTGL